METTTIINDISDMSCYCNRMCFIKHTATSSHANQNSSEASLQERKMDKVITIPISIQISQKCITFQMLFWCFSTLIFSVIKVSFKVIFRQIHMELDYL